MLFFIFTVKLWVVLGLTLLLLHYVVCVCRVLLEIPYGNYSAYVPDVPGCVATGATLDEVQQAMQEALAFHLEGLREEGLPIPQPSTVAYVEVAA